MICYRDWCSSLLATYHLNMNHAPRQDAAFGPGYLVGSAACALPCSLGWQSLILASDSPLCCQLPVASLPLHAETESKKAGRPMGVGGVRARRDAFRPTFAVCHLGICHSPAAVNADFSPCSKSVIGCINTHFACSLHHLLLLLLLITPFFHLSSSTTSTSPG